MPNQKKGAHAVLYACLSLLGVGVCGGDEGGGNLFQGGFKSAFGYEPGIALDTSDSSLTPHKSPDGSNYSYGKSLEPGYAPFQKVEISKTPKSNLVAALEASVTLSSADDCAHTAEKLTLRMEKELGVTAKRQSPIPGWIANETSQGTRQLSIMCQSKVLVLSLEDEALKNRALLEWAGKTQ
ncbi:hypothetical protein [Nevskia soli]|uniref:hypothetical protein n=1 Tax=Nevskia soli TaxID=418856 RepID=UPI0004A6FE23|nr:hypothetical protein [Nevskia soli]